MINNFLIDGELIISKSAILLIRLFVVIDGIIGICISELQLFDFHWILVIEKY